MEKELFNGVVDEYFDGYVNNKNGSVGDLSQYYWSTDYLSVNEGDIIRFQMKFPTSLGACYDENKQYVIGINLSELDENLNYTIKSGVKFIRVSIEKGRVKNDISNYKLYIIYKHEDMIEDEEKDEVVEEVSVKMEKELFNGMREEYFDGYVNNKNGSVGDLPQYYWSTDYLSVNEGDIIRFQMKFPTSLGACYDENKQYIIGINLSELDENLNYTIKSRVKFIRVSIEKGRVNNDIGNYKLYIVYKNDNTIDDENKDEDEVLEVSSVKEMKVMDLIEGMIIKTKGYYKENDNGSALYKIMTYDEWYNNVLPKDILYIREGNYFVQTPIDNYGNHLLNNGLVAIIQGDKYTPEQWGAVGDGVTNDTWAFIHMFAHIKTGEINFRKDTTYLLGVTEDNPYRIYMCGILLGGQPFYKPIMSNVKNLVLNGNGCLITLPDNEFGDSGMGIFNFSQDIENLEIKHFNFDGKGKTMGYENKNSNHTLFYSPGTLYLNVLGNIGYEHYKYSPKYNLTEPNVSFKPSHIKNINIHHNKFNDAGAIYSKAGDYGGDFILIVNPTELDGLYIEDNEFNNWGRWVFSIDLGGNGERLYNIKFNRNKCLGANRNEVLGSDTWKWRALGLIDFEAKKCFSNVEVCDNYIEGTSGWALNGASRVNENIIIKNNVWKNLSGGYPYTFEWYSGEMRDILIDNNTFEGAKSMKLGYTTHNLTCSRNTLDSHFRLLSMSGDMIFDSNISKAAVQKLVSIDLLNEPTYLLEDDKVCNFYFRNNIGGLYGSIDKNSSYNNNYNLNLFIENNKSNAFDFNMFIKNKFTFDPNQIDRNNLKSFIARGASFINPTFSQNSTVAYGGGIYEKGDIITTNVRNAGVSRTYFFSNDNIISDFKKYNYNFNTYCEVKKITDLGVKCIESGFIPSIGNWGFVNQETYFNTVNGGKVQKGAYIYTDKSLYYCLNAGTLGNDEPTHLDGIITSGEVQLLYIMNIGKVEVYTIE